ncbi:hypothetical protein HL10_gp119 [Cronobacter phage CR8]|uniref:Uncharacterized protein n=1 Tax=Cronobacter phage CR8 TaxID=1327934 RepID=A0A060AGY8_9CAUD|nr:hypothetical protein HL10_gp119 [Cronobacter phage CR8]AIA64649.1 hypothetical protein CR8_119 [Cronobacter phage CR8]UTC25317.1 hypothetical protein P7_127 [Pectobacterium phage vB_PcaM_P7_Pc]
MRVRQHRGSLVESLKTVKQIPATKEALADHINMVMDFPVKFGPGSISLIYQGIDDRIGWKTYMITVAGLGVFGYCDEEVK